MGISGLLQSLKGCMDSVHVRAYAHQRVGIDSYAWLHKGAYLCARELCIGEFTTKYLDWCMARVELLLRHSVIPVMIFDGGPLPSKSLTEQGRRDSREKNRAAGLAALAQGDSSSAYKFFQKALDVTPAMARALIEKCQSVGVECIVAPYEADAQLAFLSQTNYISCVFTEDSDLLVFGCKRVLFKLDKEGTGEEFRSRNLGACKELSFFQWSHEMFQLFAILSGCDYLQSIEGIGIKKAHALVAQQRTLENCLRRLRLDGKHNIPKDYEQKCWQAIATFRHQRVFDRETRQLVHLNTITQEISDKFPGSTMEFLGPDIEAALACDIADGKVDPETKRPFNEALQSRAQDLTITADIEIPAASRIALSAPTESSKPRPPILSRAQSAVSAIAHKQSIAAFFVNSSNAAKADFVPPRRSSDNGRAEFFGKFQFSAGKQKNKSPTKTDNGERAALLRAYSGPLNINSGNLTQRSPARPVAITNCLQLSIHPPAAQAIVGTFDDEEDFACEASKISQPAKSSPTTENPRVLALSQFAFSNKENSPSSKRKIVESPLSSKKSRPLQEISQTSQNSSQSSHCSSSSSLSSSSESKTFSKPKIPAPSSTPAARSFLSQFQFSSSSKAHNEIIENPVAAEFYAALSTG